MKPTFRRGLTGVPPAMRKAVSREGTTSFSSWLWILPPNNGPISIAIRHWRQRLRRNPLNVQYTHLLSSSDRTLFLTVVYWVVMYSICCKKVATKKKKWIWGFFNYPNEWISEGGKVLTAGVLLANVFKSLMLVLMNRRVLLMCELRLWFAA